jgi:hypothetical protein
MIAISALSVQTVRHAYLRWIQPQSSILEKYNPTLKNKIKEADSLESLDKEYAKIKKEVEIAEGEMKEQAREMNRLNKEPFKTERELQTAIKNWERHSAEIRQTRFFWTCGLILSFAGLLLFIKCPWFGLSFIIAGISQMIWWVSPSFSYNEASSEYHRMLENKFFLSLSTFIFVIVLWFLFKKYSALKKGSEGK